MSWASHDSIQCRTPASGATTASAESQEREGFAVLERAHDQGAQHADADEGDDPRDAEEEGGGELSPPAAGPAPAARG